MLTMAEIRVKVIPDLSEMKKRLKGSMNSRFGGSSGGGSGAGSAFAGAGIAEGVESLNQNTKKQTKATGSKLGGIIKGLAPLAILSQLKPIQDLLNILLGFIAFGILKVIKGIGNGIKSLPEKLKTIGEIPAKAFRTVIGGLETFFKNIFDPIKKTWNTIKEKISDFKDNLVSKVQELREKFNEFKENIKNLKDKVVDKLSSIISSIGAFFTDLWSKMKEKFNDFVENLKTTWQNIKRLPEKIRDKIKTLWDDLKKSFNEKIEGLVSVVEKVRDFLSDIWNGIKNLASDIADKIRGAIGNLNPFKRSTSVDDAIIKPNGNVIKTNPNDTIIATQTPNNMGGGQKVFNFYGVTPEEMVDTIRRELRTDLYNNSRL